MKRICIFCGGSRLTKEHLLPKWMQNYFNSSGGKHVIGRADGSTYEYEEKTFGRTARIVCESCNSGWMSSLEGEIESLLGPIISNKAPTIMIGLTAYERSMIAHWVAKTMTVLEYAGNASKNNIPKSVPETLYRTRTLMPEHTIYMGYRKDFYGSNKNHAAGFLVQNPVNLKVKQENKKIIEQFRKDGAGVFSAALIIGRVYFYMVGTDINDGFAFIYPYRPNQLLQLWPAESTDNVVWPPKQSIEDNGGWDEMNALLNQSVAVDFHITK